MGRILDELTKKLNMSGIHPLRQLGRAVGVYSPTNKKKEELIADILAIATNRADPIVNNHRGAPPKSEDYDKALLADVERCRRYYAGLTLAETEDELPPSSLTVASPDCGDDELLCSGILENEDKYWFVRTRNMQISSGADVFVQSAFINRFKMRTGDFVVCKAKRREGENPSATYIVSVNGVSPDDLRRVPFENFTPCYPSERIRLEYPGCSLTERVIDLFAPVGKGQRAIIFAPPLSGATSMLRSIALSIVKNHPQINVVAVLIDARPEEMTDFRRAVAGAEIACSSFDRGSAHHIHTAKLALEHAKRLVESGRDVVLLIDSLTALVRAYLNSGRSPQSMPDAQAFIESKRFLGAARNTEEGGSLTIIGTATLGCSPTDEAVRDEFGRIINMQIVLSRELAVEGVYPAFDMAFSGARQEDLLLTRAQCSAASAVRSAVARGMSFKGVLDAMAASNDNDDFVENVSGYLERFKND